MPNHALNRTPEKPLFSASGSLARRRLAPRWNSGESWSTRPEKKDGVTSLPGLRTAYFQKSFVDLCEHGLYIVRLFRCQN